MSMRGKAGRGNMKAFYKPSKIGDQYMIFNNRCYLIKLTCQAPMHVLLQILEIQTTQGKIKSAPFEVIEHEGLSITTQGREKR